MQISRLVDKRQAQRFRMHLPVTYKVIAGSDFAKTVTRDISNTGLKFISEGFIAPLTEVALQINLFSKMLTPTAKVVWSERIPYSDRYYSGLQFNKFNPEETRYLKDYLSLHK